MAINFKFDIHDFSLENIVSWPNYLKGIALGAMCAILIGIVYYVDTSSQRDVLDSYTHREVDLRAEFEKKQGQAQNLEIYRDQIGEMRRLFGAMLEQLPSKTEVPTLLEDISKAGIASGLEFRLFDPQAEIKHDFYAELPIHLIVIGTYHQLGDFVGRVAALDRIVTLHNFKINQASDDSSSKPAANKADAKMSGLLLMDITAKTYRYVEGQNNEKT